MMSFKYFQGPMKDMAFFREEPSACTLCGAVRPGFALDYALCPALPTDMKERGRGCYDCLRAGRFEFWHDTEVGLLDERGLTKEYRDHRLPCSGFPEEARIELRRTPQIVTWQQERWLTHCDDFMAYIGTWGPGDFYANAEGGDGRALFRAMTDADLGHLWEASLPAGKERLESWYATYYTFKCLHCGRYRGNWDCD